MKEGVRLFKSIRTKLIATVAILFIIGVGAMTFTSSSQVKTKTEDALLTQSASLANEMGNSITHFFAQFEKGLIQLSTSVPVLSFEGESDAIEAEQADQLYDTLYAELSKVHNLYEDTVTVYYAHPDEFVDVLDDDLGDDYDPTSRPWYQDAENNPDVVNWSSPYMDAATGEYVITASKAVEKNGRFNGVIAADIELTTITEQLSQTEIDYAGYPIVLDDQGISIVHPTQQGEDFMAYSYATEMYDSENDHGVIYYEQEGIERINIFSTIPEFGWKVGLVYDEKNINATANQLGTSMLIIALITLILFSVILTIIIRRMLMPLSKLNGLMDKVSDGDLTVRSDFQSADEIGQLSTNFNTMIENMNHIIGVVNNSALNVRSSSESLSAVSEETNASSEEVAHAVNEIARGAATSAEDAEIVTERADSLGNQINEITNKATAMADIAIKADAMNNSGRTQMNELKSSFTESETTLQTMASEIGALEDKVSDIGQVMNTITEISAQTNLLALNASIEAARAGEHGQGFAVVAEEVRKLAEQSARATEEVQATVQELQAETRLVSQQLENTRDNFQSQGTVVNETEMTFSDISQLMTDMQGAIDSVATEITHVATLKDDVAETIQTMAATSQQTAAACEEVSASSDEQLRAIQSVTDAAEELTELSEELTNAVNRFTV